MSSMHDVLGLVPALHKLSLVAQDCNANIREAKNEGPEEVQGHPQKQGEYKTSLG